MITDEGIKDLSESFGKLQKLLKCTLDIQRYLNKELLSYISCEQVTDRSLLYIAKSVEGMTSLESFFLKLF